MAIYALGDLHGRKDLYFAIKRFLDHKDVVIFLGDANDRGPDSWSLVKMILNDPQFVYLKGNHEQLLLDGFSLYWSGELDQDAIAELADCGTLQTLTEVIEDDYGTAWIRTLNKNLLPFYVYKNAKGENVFLSHAGFTPFVDEVNGEIVLPNDELLTWDRNHSSDNWPANAENIIVVHGHTPTGLLHQELFPLQTDVELDLSALWYADSHKVDIDIGAVWQDCALLINLDDWTEHLIKLPTKESR